MSYESVQKNFQMPLPIKDGEWWNGKPKEFSNLQQWDVKWTQNFSSHPEWYEKWGLDGHNGIDWRYNFDCPVVTPLRMFTQFVGVNNAIKGYDPDGYGNYVRLYTETIDGTFLEVVMAHFKTINIEQGKWYDKDTLIGTGGSTGNSSGPHLHLGIRPHITLPNGNTQIEDYNNGYFGYIDPAPFFPKTKWTFKEYNQLKENTMQTNIKILQVENKSDIYIGIPVKEEKAMKSYMDNYGVEYKLLADGSFDWDSINIKGIIKLDE